MSKRRLAVVLIVALLVLAGGVSVAVLWRGGAQPPQLPAGSAGGPAAAARGVVDAPGNCPACGMLVTPGDLHAGKAVLRDGSTRVFCGAGCMLRWMHKTLRPHGEGSELGQDAVVELMIADHYTGRPLDARQALFVFGSDVVGRMGPAIVPVADATEAAQLIKDHGGRALPFAQIDAALLDRVAGGGKP